jgi:hypothetical protein
MSTWETIIFFCGCWQIGAWAGEFASQMYREHKTSKR